MSDIKISAKDVKKLRDQTGAGMMDCKKALVEAKGDYDLATELLRKKGQKLSDKRADREANEGVVIAVVSSDATKGAVVRLSCETDFVSKNEAFVDFTSKIANIALENMPATKEDLLALSYDGSISIGDKVTEQIGVIGEKLEVAAYEKMEAPMITSYIHMGNKAGVLVGLNKANNSFVTAGKDVAMQIAAMKPIAVSKSEVAQDLLDKEFRIGREMAAQEGKPEAMLDKIAEGRLNKFLKEKTLLPQAFVKDSKQSVEQYLKSQDPELTVVAFKHVTLG